MTHDLKQRLVAIGWTGAVNPDGPAALARIEELEGALALFTRYSMSSASLSRGESSIGWQRGDGLTASERVSIARAALKGEERNG